jgi:glucose-6-phosphate 1-dehydrogenase
MDSVQHKHPSAAMPAQHAFTAVGVCEIEVPRPCCFVIFGATGDLARRKLMPALFRLTAKKILPPECCIVGAGRTALSDAEYRESIRASLEAEAMKDVPSSAWEQFAGRLYYVPLSYDAPEQYSRDLNEKLAAVEQRHHTLGNRVFYLAVPPSAVEQLARNLAAAGLSAEGTAFRSVVIEKPFGRDLESARRLNRSLHRVLSERQIYRIDHYLAKETVQSMLMFRFANVVFEPLWNRRYIDHVQITAAETLGIERRAGYYEEAGVLRDMFQNHLFQLLSLTAMEPPAAFAADGVWDEKVKVFRSLRPVSPDRLSADLVIGQYRAGEVSGSRVPGYLDEHGVRSGSRTPTYAAMKLFIDNERWQGVPFYLRSGKRLARRRTEIAIRFKTVPRLMFESVMQEGIEPNELLFRIQPDEGISLRFQTKMPGSKVCLKPETMDFSQGAGRELDAYEWVLLDCIYGDRMLFQREDSVDLTWQYLTPLIKAVESGEDRCPLRRYPSGSEGPVEAAQLIERDGRAWRPL